MTVLPRAIRGRPGRRHARHSGFPGAAGPGHLRRRKPCRARCGAGSATRRRRSRRSCCCRIGWLATASSIWRFCLRIRCRGHLDSPPAMARSSSALLSAIERSDERQLAERLGDRDLLGDLGRRLERDVGEGLRPGLAVLVLRWSVRWSVASTRRLRMIVSETLSGGPSPPPATVWVSTRSTRSPGKTKPATPLVARNRHRHGAHARAERRGEEAAIAGLDQRALGQRLAGGDRVAHDRADQLLRIAINAALDVIGALDQFLGPGLVVEAVRLEDRADRQRFGRDQYFGSERNRRSCGSRLRPPRR